MKQRKAYSYIRFSTPEQIKGDSLNRQLDATIRYCKENNLTLDESLSFQDLGLSAYHGIHKSQGALKRFLDFVEDGRVEKGSVLIVENFDRLSREQILTALNQFTGIIQAGIKVVTLQDGMEYDEESINKNWSQLIISITYMARAHDESKIKSERIRAAKQKKRDRARTTKQAYTSRAPHWLKINKRTRKFEVIPKVAEAIKRAFELKLQGYGALTIAQELNNNAKLWKPPVTKSNKTGGWSPSYISSLLRSRAVIGEYQPRVTKKVTNGVYEFSSDGEPFKGYYPPIIDEELFLRVQHKLEKDGSKKGKSGGRKTKARNILSSVALCGNCGGSLYYTEGSIPGKYPARLICNNKRRGQLDKDGNRVCEIKPFNYNEVVEIILNELEELDIEKLLTKKKQKNEIDTLKQQIEGLEAKNKDIQRRQNNLIDEIENEDDRELRKILNDRVKQLINEAESIKNELNEKNAELSHLLSDKHTFKDNIEKIKTLRALKEKIKEDNEEAKSIRLQLNNQIRDLCQYIIIYPLKEKYVPQKEIEPGVYQIMKSKKIDRIEIKFNSKRYKKAVIYLNTFGEIKS